MYLWQASYNNKVDCVNRLGFLSIFLINLAGHYNYSYFFSIISTILSFYRSKCSSAKWVSAEGLSRPVLTKQMYGPVHHNLLKQHFFFQKYKHIFREHTKRYEYNVLQLYA